MAGRPRCRIDIRHGSLFDVQAAAAVNPANSLGAMAGGVAGALKRVAGQAVEDEARRHAPIPVGQAIVTSGGRSRFPAIIHAPTMPSPGMAIPVDHVRLAIRAALQIAEANGFDSLAIPGMGTGVGGVPPAEAAAAMIEEIHAFDAHRLRCVTLIDIDAGLVEAWRQVADHTASS